MIATGINKEISGFPTSVIFPTHFQQLEYLGNTSGYGVYVFIKGEGEHMLFFFFFTLK